MPYTDDPGGGGGLGSVPGGLGFAGQGRTNGVGSNRKTPTYETTKNVNYVAGSADSNQVLSIAQADSSSAVKTAIPNSIIVRNVGIVPTIVITEYEGYSDEDTDAGRHTLQTMLMPGESMLPPVRGVIPTANQLRVLDGTVVAFAPTLGDGTAITALKSDSGDNVASGELNNTTALVIFELDNGDEKYVPGDYLRCENEIIRVEGTSGDNPTAETVPDNHIVASRGHFGSTSAAHSGTPDIYFHCFNEYYDYDRVLQGNSQLNTTDGLGRYKSCNFFGYGRTDATADDKTFGIVPGSACFRFYSRAYMDIPMGGTGVAGGTGGSNIPITSASASLLTGGQEYSINLTIDDSSATTVSFTISEINTKFGGPSGVIEKIQSAIDTATRTAGNNLFGYSCSVSITDGKLRITSDSHLSPHDGTNGSQILIEDGAGGTNLLTGANGIFPDINNSIAAVKPIIAPISIYNPITYAKTPNLAGICYDNGLGQLIYNGATIGRINYYTGAFNFRGAPANAEFEISLAHGTPFAGKIDTAEEDTSCITAIHANVINNNVAGKINIQVF